MNSLITLTLRNKRDILLARQRARRIAVLLNFDPDDQACIAAGAFAVAAEALRRCRVAELRIQIENRSLHIFAPNVFAPNVIAPNAVNGPRPSTIGFQPEQLRLVKKLPPDRMDIAGEDLRWLAVQLNDHGTLGRASLFDEVRNQNQEVLALLSALREARLEIQNLQNSIAA